MQLPHNRLEHAIFVLKLTFHIGLCRTLRGATYNLRKYCKYACLLRLRKPVCILDLEPISGPRVFGHARWRKDWVKVSSDLAQDRRAWSASVRDVVNAVGDAGSTRPG